MLSIFEGDGRLNRRQMLTVGALGLGGLTLPSLMPGISWGSETPKHVTGKSVIYLFQQGGPSQFETFDPKPEAPDAIRTVTGVIPTSVPGVAFGDCMPQLAKIAHKLTVVRSFQTNNGGHNIQPIVGPDSLEANIGVHYSRVVGATRTDTGMPTNAVLYPSSVDPEVPGPSARGNLASTGSYGSSYAPFTPGAKGNLQQDMQLHLPKERFFDDRRQILTQLDTLNRRVDASGQLEALDELQQQAYQVLLGGGVAKALDLSNEDPRTLARYDTRGFYKKGQWNHAARGRSGYYDAQSKTIGKLLLMARRLCEAGAGFVTIHAGYAGIWDMHADGNNLNVTDGMQAVGRPLDHAVAAFVDDLEERGLEDKIMLVCTGEMGRTPKINSRGGRDHWSRLAPLLVYGGGAQPGVIGQSTRDGAEPQTDAYNPSHLISTLMNTVFNMGELRLVPSVPAPINTLGQADMIPVFGW
ncbi:DUF1501 domain-containing protein [Lignipirellula cremea]|uniref:DUF1501 domain-containing protein n=1 Tax=Lignipirellula cremea TaxID=2528010 RepID=A0A518E2A2_9BACT|nr:DUF1501 domain-containing protein [Lignipirellula cremea]QDU98226.1 hypothetical protein Pla8534_60870 [Lignipirellula cremea]